MKGINEDEKGGREDWNCKSNARRRKERRKLEGLVQEKKGSWGSGSQTRCWERLKVKGEGGRG